MTWPTEIRIDEWRPDRRGAASLDADLAMLGEILHAVVHDGAGVSFIVPFGADEARAFWRDTVLPRVRAGSRRVLIACRNARIIGTVQLDLAMPRTSSIGPRWQSCSCIPTPAGAAWPAR